MANKLPRTKTKKAGGLVAKTQKQEMDDKELFSEVKTAYEEVYSDNYREKVLQDMVP